MPELQSLKVNTNCSYQSNCVICVVLLRFASWLVEKTRANLSTNQMQNHNQSWRGSLAFSRASGSYFTSYWLSVISPLIWLAVVINLVLLWRHSKENLSKKGKLQNVKLTAATRCSQSFLSSDNTDWTFAISSVSSLLL